MPVKKFTVTPRQYFELKYGDITDVNLVVNFYLLLDLSGNYVPVYF